VAFDHLVHVALDIQAWQAAADPASAEWQRDLSVTRQKI
jgi:hypothetical protein